MSLAVGHPARPALGHAVLGSFAVGALFFAFAWIAKEVPSLYVHAPWENDPYDAVVSFALFFVPVLLALGAVRIPLCRRERPLPARRASDLLRASRVLVAIVLIALAAEWASVASGAEPSGGRTGATTLLTIALLPLTAAALTVAHWLWRAGRAVGDGAAKDSAALDWLADAIALGEREAARLGRYGYLAQRVLRLIDTEVAHRIRRHRVATAALLSVTFGLAIAAAQALGEGYTARAALIVAAVASTGMFAFLIAIGSHLRLVEKPAPPARPPLTS